ncbi:MAG: hypothetical protein F4X82_00980 [Candidatus Spechtbacteria bacterium SB0662_bin_43]|uniref:Uncharacterized protein n=1 Tax=Candidatus Spechtbacteria bacterium SB0662_bin_43 TaxID=2604897 RepID=A0A845D9F8_9BACT|nr:hypothetical protein [Candidatus Spechtbacteria bacterium SB0662_bin_43]
MEHSNHKVTSITLASFSKTIFSIALAIVFLSSFFYTSYGVISLVRNVMYTYVFSADSRCLENEYIRVYDSYDKEDEKAQKERYENCKKNDRKRVQGAISQAVADIVVGSPLLFLSFRYIYQKKRYIKEQK